MTRLAPALALLCGALAVPTTYASAQQPQKAAPTAASPAAPAKFYRPVKGVATILLIQGPSKKVGTDMVTTIQVKNTSAGRINLLQVDEYWYDKNVKVVTGSTDKWRKPFNPGDVIEITLKSPWKPNLYRNQLMFAHSGGKVDVKQVKKFD